MYCVVDADYKEAGQNYKGVLKSKKSRTMKKIVAASCAGLMAVSMGITSLALDVGPFEFKNSWLDYGYNQGTSRSQWGGGALKVVLAHVRRRSDNYVVSYDQQQGYNGAVATASGSWNYSNYKNTGTYYTP